MLALLIAVLSASLIGSMHCAGMCGAFVLFAVGAGGLETEECAGVRAGPSRFMLTSAYNLGRLVTYVVLGLLAGTLGSALDLGGAMIGVQRLAAGIAGGLMVAFGVIAFLRHSGMRIARWPVPRALVRVAQAGHERALTLSPVWRAACVGLLTTLLPCGWLYAFVITSAGTGHPLYGAATMAVFWLGTLPIMAAIGLGAQALAGPLRRHLPLATSLALVGVGLWTVIGRIGAPAIDTASMRMPGTLSDAVSAVGSRTADEACPLCHTPE